MFSYFGNLIGLGSGAQCIHPMQTDEDNAPRDVPKLKPSTKSSKKGRSSSGEAIVVDTIRSSSSVNDMYQAENVHNDGFIFDDINRDDGNSSSDSNSDNDREIGQKEKVSNRKGAKYNLKTEFIFDLVDVIVKDMISNKNLPSGQKNKDYLSREKMASKYDVKPAELQKIQSLHDKSLGVEDIVNQMNHRGSFSYNQLQSVMAAEREAGTGLTKIGQLRALHEGSKMDVELGLLKGINNSECIPTYEEEAFSLFRENTLDTLCQFSERKAKSKFVNRKIKTEELWGHLTGAMTYLVATFENPSFENLGDRKVDAALNFNTDDSCVELGYQMDQSYTVKISRGSRDWMDETRYNPVAPIEGDKLKRICVHVRPTIAENGKLMCLITYNKDRDLDGFQIIALRPEVEEYSFYYAVVGPGVNQKEFENQIHMEVIFPSIDRERRRLVDQSVRLQTTSIIGTIQANITPEQLEIITAKVNLKYRNANLFVDGAQGLVGALNDGMPLSARAKDLNTFLWKFAAQHSLCQNACDASHGFPIIHTDYGKIQKSGLLSNEVPAWHDTLMLFVKTKVKNAERQKTIGVFHTFLPRVMAHALSTHINSKGWISNGMGVGVSIETGLAEDKFKLSKWLNHWPSFRLLTDGEVAILYDLIWTKAMPLHSQNHGVSTHAQLHEIFKEFLELDELDVNDNRNVQVFNQGFAMAMQEQSFLAYAEEKRRVTALVADASARKKILDDQVKNATKAANKARETALCLNIDTKKDTDIDSINATKNATITTAKNNLKERKATINKRKNKSNTNQDKINIAADIEHANLAFKALNSFHQQKAKEDIDIIKRDWTLERKQLIKANKDDLRNFGYVAAQGEVHDDDDDDDEEEPATNELNDDNNDEEDDDIRNIED